MKKLFGTDGIRGIAGEYPFVEDFVKKIGYVSAKFLDGSSAGKILKREIILGSDTRESCRWIAQSISEGITCAGIKVVDVGVSPTPLVAYIASKRASVAGCVISASHNPSEFNGIKFFSNSGTKIPDEKELEIEKILIAGEIAFPKKNDAIISYRDTYAHKLYTKYLFSALGRNYDLSGLKIVIDCANGSNYRMAPEIFSKLNANTVLLSVEPDGKNINKNCGSLHLRNLQNAVAENKADFGIAYDGDGDRCLFVDDACEVRDGDYLIAIAATELKKGKKLKNNAVVASVMANFGFYKAMETAGINVFKSDVGDKYVYQKMVENGIILGGEQSGHIIFRNYLNTGDGLLTSLMISSIIKQSKKPLSELSKIMKKYPQILLNKKVYKKVPINENKKLLEEIKKAEGKLRGNGRVLVRYSGTEPLLRIMVEGPDDNIIEKIAADIASVVGF